MVQSVWRTLYSPGVPVPARLSEEWGGWGALHVGRELVHPAREGEAGEGAALGDSRMARVPKAEPARPILGTILEAPVPERSAFEKKKVPLVKYMVFHARWNCDSFGAPSHLARRRPPDAGAEAPSRRRRVACSVGIVSGAKRCRRVCGRLPVWLPCFLAAWPPCFTNSLAVCLRSSQVRAYDDRA